MNHEQTQEVLRDLLLRLERVQREVGEVQIELIRLLKSEEGTPTVPSSVASAVVSPVEELEELEEVVGTLTPAMSCINPVEWLARRRVTVLRQSEPSALDEAFDKLAMFLGERFQNLRPFYEAIKRRVAGRPYPRALKLTNSPPRVISDICQFGSLLYEHGFLKSYSYNRTTRTLVFDPQDDGRVTNFFTGDWLERYVLLTALERAGTLLPQGVEPVVLKKAVLALPDKQETELDILLGLPDRVLWLECKTGEDWREHATKFGRIARCLSIPPSHAALVLIETLEPLPKQTASVLSWMTVINPEELEEFIEAALTATKFRPSITWQGVAEVLQPVSPPLAPGPARAAYVAWLNKVGLRPLEPNLRKQIVEDLIQLHAEERLPLPELGKRLKARYGVAGKVVSKNQINDVLSALRRAGMCEWGAHFDYPNGVWFLRSDVGAEEMLKQCSLLYLWTLLKNPAWPTSRHLDARVVVDLLHWGLESGQLEPLLEEMTKQGKCKRQGDEWVAVGESFAAKPDLFLHEPAPIYSQEGREETA